MFNSYKKLFIRCLTIFLFIFCFISFGYSASANDITPVDIHGQLSVSGKNIIDEQGNVFQLRGVSTHGIYWYPDYVSQDSLNYMRDEWSINAIRLAMYSDPASGRNPSTYELVKQGVDYATNAGLYVIIDWHILRDGNPNIYKEDAIEFFKEVATLYKDNKNVIYEICNEPNGEDVSWDLTVKPYAEEVIGEIRKIDEDAIIVVGSSTWSQDLDKVVQNPITEYDNLVYTLHFYAGSHKDNLRNKVKTVLESNLPILVSEFGICNANGDGELDYDSADAWFNILDENNIGFMIWQLSNKDEGSSLIKNDVTKLTDWNYDELTDHGKWFVNKLKEYQDDEIAKEEKKEIIEETDINRINAININVEIPSVASDMIPNVILADNINYKLEYANYLNELPVNDEVYYADNFEDGKDYYIEISLLANDDYVFANTDEIVLNVNGENIDYQLFDENKKIVFYFKFNPIRIIYNYLVGNNLNYINDESDSATFIIDADYSLFNGLVYVNNNLVDSSNYISKSGSTIITFTKEYMSSLTTGIYTLKVVFNNGGIAETTFNVLNETLINPKTGDSIIMYITIGGLIIFVIVAILIYLKK